MSRSLQFCALIYLISSITAEPNCDGIEAEDLEDCRTLHRRWYEIQDELFLQKCKLLRRDDADAYNSCMRTVNEEATNRLYSEVSEEGKLNPFISLGAKPTLVNGRWKKLKFSTSK